MKLLLRYARMPMTSKQKRWTETAGCRSGYEALKEEFSLASLVSRAGGRANLTQAELAVRMGTSIGTVVALETVEPRLSMLNRLAEKSWTRLALHGLKKSC